MSSFFIADSLSTAKFLLCTFAVCEWPAKLSPLLAARHILVRLSCSVVRPSMKTHFLNDKNLERFDISAKG